ncbi:hypothetical protein [Neisseria sicca]|nr:hypothetical protein [Neisseria sicca]
MRKFAVMKKRRLKTCSQVFRRRFFISQRQVRLPTLSQQLICYPL